MKEKDADTSPRYMSPIVKQDLARLDKDTESRRSAMNSLTRFVEKLDPASMHRFINQVSEIRDQGATNSHAITLYVEVARAHGKHVIPHIPRVMSTVTKALSSSGSSPQHHQSCAKVVSSFARYSIDDSTLSQADHILRQLCDPLLEVLAGKLEPLAAGAAVCLQALVESGKWDKASDELVNEACLRTAVAMGEKATRTVAHMQLTCALATANPTFMGVYGVALLRAGVDILRLTPASSTWQQRACAARLLQVVFPIVDEATISSEFGPTIQALDSCKHDRMPRVRTAVSGALKTAKALLMGDNERRIGDGMDPLGIPPLNFFSEHDKHYRKASRRKSLFAVSDVYMPYAAPRRASCCAPLCFSQVSQESQIVSFPPSLSSESSASSFVSPPPTRSRRTPLFPTRTSHKCSSQTSSVCSAETFDGYFHSDRVNEGPAKENVPACNPDVNAGVPWDIGIASGGSPWSGGVGKYARPRPPTPGSHIPYPPSLSDKLGTDQQSRDIDVSPVVMLKGRQGRSFNHIEDSELTSSREQEGDVLAQDEEVFSNGGATVDNDAESDTSSSRGSTHSVLSRISSQSDQTANSQAKTGRESIGSFSVSGSVRSRSVLSGPTMKNVFELKGPVNASATKSAEQPVRPVADEEDIRPPDDYPGSDCKEAMDALCNLRAHYNSLAHLRTMEELYSPQKPKALITAEDFLPYSTPRRLVRSLQSTLSSPDSVSGSAGDQDAKSTGEVVDMADMDMETSSEAGWSVRDNPIASDDSFKSDSDEDDKGRKICKKMSADLNRENIFAGSESITTSDACERTTLSVSGFASEPTGVKSPSLKDGRVTKPEEDVEIIKRTQQEGISTSYSQSLGGLRSLLVEDCTYDCTCGGKDESKQQSEGEIICKEAHYSDIMSPRGRLREKVSMVISSRVGDFISKRWRSVRAYAEVFLGGSLLVVLALPFAMAMSKIFLSRAELPGLVPT